MSSYCLEIIVESGYDWTSYGIFKNTWVNKFYFAQNTIGKYFENFEDCKNYWLHNGKEIVSDFKNAYPARDFHVNIISFNTETVISHLALTANYEEDDKYKYYCITFTDCFNNIKNYFLFTDEQSKLISKCEFLLNQFRHTNEAMAVRSYLDDAKYPNKKFKWAEYYQSAECKKFLESCKYSYEIINPREDKYKKVFWEKI